MSALVYAAKDMEIAETTIHMPVSEVVVPATTARESKDSERATLLLFSSVACASACKVFAPKSSSAARNPAVTIFPAKSALRNPAMILPLHIHWPLVDNHVPSAEVIKGRRRRGGPFQRSALPRIV